MHATCYCGRGQGGSNANHAAVTVLPTKLRVCGVGAPVDKVAQVLQQLVVVARLKV